MKARTAIVVSALLAVLAPTAAAADGPLRVAVMDFHPAAEGDELASLGKGLQSMLTTDLSAVPGMALIERSRLEDIRAELDLSRTGVIDPATAVRIGKLAAATHLVVGTFTVVGQTMRLDARMVEVATGEVALTAQVEGERDAFFELQKGLVRRLVAAFGVQLAPRERAQLGQLHTADFDAFRDFSRGIDLFDAQRYDEAVEALRAATRQDADFRLAALTLAEYERLIRALRDRADVADRTAVEADQLRRLAARSSEAAVLERLFGIAAREGDRHQRARLAALFALAVSYANLGAMDAPGAGGALPFLRSSEDRFAMERTGEAMARRYVAEARGLFPAVPAFPTLALLEPLPTAPDGVDAWLEAQIARLWAGGPEEPARLAAMREQLTPDNLQTALRLLLLDRREGARLHEELLERAEPVLDPAARLLHQRVLAVTWRSLLDLDRATAILERAATQTDAAADLRAIADSVEVNRDAAATLAAAGALRPYVEEWIASVGATHLQWRRNRAELFAGPTLDPRARRELTMSRRMIGYRFGLRGGHQYYPVHLGRSPLWLVQSTGDVLTGPRSAEGHAREVRIVDQGDQGKAPGPRDPRLRFSLFVLDGAPRDEVTATFTVSHRVAADWGEATGERVAEGRPAVSFAFGVEDVHAAEVVDPHTREAALARPLRLYAVTLDAGRARLSRLVETARAGVGHKTDFAREVVAEAPLPAPAGDDVTVTVAVGPTGITVTAGGHHASLPGVAERRGFYGFWVEGPGQVTIRDVEIQ